ncbi:hypothetical protein [Endozoicomonas lisbonensis]|uniref:hypothetical protein n=1 Tax=Endozoicomonas lisbonensis TaxID=3120522 RepID=UPI0033954A50
MLFVVLAAVLGTTVILLLVELFVFIEVVGPKEQAIRFCLALLYIPTLTYAVLIFRQSWSDWREFQRQFIEFCEDDQIRHR